MINKQKNRDGKKHRRNWTDFERLVQKMERDGDYQTNHIKLRSRRDRQRKK
jgi:hypothetical protein